MSSNIARDTLVGTFKNLWGCDGGVKTDFIIESADGDGGKATLHACDVGGTY